MPGSAWHFYGTRYVERLLTRPDGQAGQEGHGHEHGGIFSVSIELAFALICGALRACHRHTKRHSLGHCHGRTRKVLVNGRAPREKLDSLNAMALDNTGLLSVRPTELGCIKITEAHVNQLLMCDWKG